MGQFKALLDGNGEFDTVRAELDLPAAHLRQVVEEFYGARRTGDLALLYYSGHGLLHDDRESVFLAAADTIADQLHATALDTDGTLRHLLASPRPARRSSCSTAASRVPSVRGTASAAESAKRRAVTTASAAPSSLPPART